jgi:hypothetical protein
MFNHALDRAIAEESHANNNPDSLRCGQFSFSKAGFPSNLKGLIDQFARQRRRESANVLRLTLPQTLYFHF